MVESGSVRLAVECHSAVLAALDEGHVGDARRLIADALDAAISAFGPDSPDLANVVLTCATVEEAAGNFTAAQTLAERAAGVAAPLVNDDDTELMALWVDIEIACARILSTLGHFEPAEHRLAAALVAARPRWP